MHHRVGLGPICSAIDASCSLVDISDREYHGTAATYNTVLTVYAKLLQLQFPFNTPSSFNQIGCGYEFLRLMIADYCAL